MKPAEQKAEFTLAAIRTLSVISDDALPGGALMLFSETEAVIDCSARSPASGALCQDLQEIDQLFRSQTIGVGERVIPVLWRKRHKHLPVTPST